MIENAICLKTEELIFIGNPVVYSAESIPGYEKQFYVSGVAKFASGQEVLYLYKDGSWHFQAIADGHNSGYFDSKAEAQAALAAEFNDLLGDADLSVVDAQVREARAAKATWRS